MFQSCDMSQGFDVAYEGLDMIYEGFEVICEGLGGDTETFEVT